MAVERTRVQVNFHGIEKTLDIYVKARLICNAMCFPHGAATRDVQDLESDSNSPGRRYASRRHGFLLGCNRLQSDRLQIRHPNTKEDHSLMQWSNW